MTDPLGWLAQHLLDDTLSTAVGALLGYLFGRVLIGWLRTRRYGGWTVKVLPPSPDTVEPDDTAARKPLTERVVSAEHAEEILNDLNRLSVFIKGVASFYARLEVDPVNTAVQVAHSDGAAEPIYHETPRPNIVFEVLFRPKGGGHRPHTLLDVDHQTRQIVLDLQYNRAANLTSDTRSDLPDFASS